MSKCLQSIRCQTWYYSTPKRVFICTAVAVAAILAAIILASSLTLHFTAGSRMLGQWRVDDFLLRIALPVGAVTIASLLVMAIFTAACGRQQSLYQKHKFIKDGEVIADKIYHLLKSDITV